jgi:nitrous oxide reductase accessory protein NosL
LKKILLLISFFTLLYSNELSDIKIAKLVKKGERIALTFCNKEELSTLEGEGLSSVIEKLKKDKICGKLSKRNYQALGYFLLSNKKKSHTTISKINVPNHAKCPVCGMFVYKYPKWSALITIHGKDYYFDGIKDMMKYYIFSDDFPFNRQKIEKILVSDYYKLEAIDANKAFYVVGSDVLGPMGNELIAFKNKKEATNFMHDHNGKDILSFKEINAKVVISLDTIE